MIYADNVHRIGLLTPSSNVSVECDFADWAPKNVTVHAARMLMRGATMIEALALAQHHAPRAAEELATLDPDVTVFACTGAGAILGPDGEQALIRQLSMLTNSPVVSTNQAVAEAVAIHSAKRIAVITPYSDDQTEAVVAARERGGVRVVRAAGMRIAANREIARVTPIELLRFCEQELADARFDLLFVSCTNLRTAPVIEPLRRRFGVPVVTSNRASFDAALAALSRRTGAPFATRIMSPERAQWLAHRRGLKPSD